MQPSHFHHTTITINDYHKLIIFSIYLCLTVMMQKWNKKRNHFSVIAFVFFIFIVASIIYGERHTTFRSFTETNNNHHPSLHLHLPSIVPPTIHLPANNCTISPSNSYTYIHENARTKEEDECPISLRSLQTSVLAHT